MRKTLANRVYGLLKHDLLKTGCALGHKNVNSPVSYPSFHKDVDVLTIEDASA